MAPVPARSRSLVVGLLLGLAVLPSGCGEAGPPPPPPSGTDVAVAGKADGAGSASVRAECRPDGRRRVPAEVRVFPDDGEAPYLEMLSRARQRIDVMVYLMGRGAILDGLKAAAAQGLQVRVILDGGPGGLRTNEKYRQELVAAGVEVHFSDPAFAYMHAKVMIVDGVEAFVSTGNYARFGIEEERNFGVHLLDRDDVADLRGLFESDWNQRAPRLTCTRLLISPLNARERLVGHIRSATRTLLIDSMQYADPAVKAAVAERHAAGVEVRVLLADADWITANARAAQGLLALGIPVRHVPHLHTKVVIADGQRAYVGSVNLSATSLDKNREVGLVLTEPAALATLLATFEADWQVGTPF